MGCLTTMLESPFKSEIEWGKWNSEIPNYPELVIEYHSIEESAKKSRTWMKNPDGTPFQGTPEQFVQQQSDWFKKAFPNPIRDKFGNIRIYYHGSSHTLEGDFFDITKHKHKIPLHGTGIYLSFDKKLIEGSFAKSGDNKGFIYELYINSNRPQTYDESALRSVTSELFDHKINLRFHPEKFDKDKAIIASKKYGELLAQSTCLRPEYDYLCPYGTPYAIIPYDNHPKSAVGNIGFFDMTNPNIYK